MKNLLFLFFLLFCGFKSYSQVYSISGRVMDEKDGSTIPGAGITLLKPDSSIAGGTATDLDGLFKLENISIGSYILKTSFIGYTQHFTNINISDKDVLLGDIKLFEATKVLKGVEVTGQLIPAIQKGDTTQYNADAYKVNEGASAEQLVTKMPGITIQDGKVQAQGEDVKQVTVDGKTYFGDDASAVLRNLPAEIVEKLQVFDKQSEQAQFTGISDGNTGKTINIITRSDIRNIPFGKIYGGYGTDETYKAGVNVNVIRKDSRFTIIAQSNNINEQNFSSEDLAGVMSSGGSEKRGSPGRSSMGGPPRGSSGPENFLVDQKGGITTTHAIGVNYNVSRNKKIEFTGSYFFNNSENDLQQATLRNYVLRSDSVRSYDEHSFYSTINSNHRFNGKFEWKPDTFRMLQITPRFSLQDINSQNRLSGINAIDKIELSSNRNDFNNEQTVMNSAGEIVYMQKFNKPGRTISIHVTGQINEADGENTLSASNLFFLSNDADSLMQKTKIDKKGSNMTSMIMYTEKIHESGLIHVNYANSFNNSINDRTTDITELSGSEFNEGILSNNIDNDYTTHRAGLGYRLHKEKVVLMATTSFQQARLNSEVKFPSEANISREFYNLLPMSILRFRFTKDKTLRIIYRTSTNNPSADQLLPVVDNSNTANLITGNPGLRQDYQHNMFFRYSSANTENGTSFFAMIGANIAENAIRNSTYVAGADTVIGSVPLTEGAQLTRPVNLNGYYSLRSFLTWSKPVSAIKSNLNFNITAAYSRTPALINEKLNYAYTPAVSGGIVISSNISKDLDFTLSGTSSYYLVRNSINRKSDNNYFNQNSKLRLNYTIKNRVVFGTDILHQYYKGLSAEVDQQYYLLNASIGIKFLKSKAAQLSITGYDILNQNTSVSRNITESYTEDIESNQLNRYFMLLFNYNLQALRKK